MNTLTKLSKTLFKKKKNGFKKISIVLPVFNEEGNLEPLFQKIKKSCSYFPYEIIAVDDGSSDSTPKELARLKTKNKNIKILTLKGNFGQSAALAAGIDHSSGDVIIPMDADGQNDPGDIPALLRKLSEGYDVVSGWRKYRKDKLLSRKIPSWLANALISKVTGVHLHDYGCTLKAYRSNIITNLQISGEMHRFLPAWCAWQGGKVTEVPVHHHPRIRGKSKYGLFRIFKVIIDLMTVKFFSGFISKPNYLFSGTGMLFFLLSLVTSAVAIYDKLGPDIFPRLRIPFLLLAVAFGLVSVFMILMGLLAELLVRLYFAVRDQKPYRIMNEKSS